MDFFRLSTAALGLLLVAVLAGSVVAGVLVGRALRDRPGARHETAGVIQGTLLGLVGLLLVFGMSMAVGRYESRRALVVQEANDIGTAY
jgi:NADH:ubiquinone oxidoreductase subunit 6 (subunit J)